jgi:hypothetical protein
MARRRTAVVSSLYLERAGPHVPAGGVGTARYAGPIHQTARPPVGALVSLGRR